MKADRAATGDFADFQSVPGLPGVEILNARYSRHRFDPHSHDEWAIAAIVSGTQDNAIGRNSNILRAGDIGAMPPGQAHAGKLLGDDPCHYAMVYVSDTAFRTRAKALGIHHPAVASTGVSDAHLAARVAAFVMHVSCPSDVLELQKEWRGLLDDFLLRYATFGINALTDTHATATVMSRLRRAHRFLTDHWDQAVSLETLADVAALSPYHFCRRFSQVYGLSPHRYQLIVRVTRAKILIARGAGLAETAQLTGFSDQSHLGRLFKACFGFSPGQLHRGSPTPLAQ